MESRIAGHWIAVLAASAAIALSAADGRSAYAPPSLTDPAKTLGGCMLSALRIPSLPKIGLGKNRPKPEPNDNKKPPTAAVTPSYVVSSTPPIAATTYDKQQKPPAAAVTPSHESKPSTAATTTTYDKQQQTTLAAVAPSYAPGPMTYEKQQKPSTAVPVPETGITAKPVQLETTTQDRAIIVVPRVQCPDGQKMGPDRNCRPNFTDPEDEN